MVLTTNLPTKIVPRLIDFWPKLIKGKLIFEWTAEGSCNIEILKEMTKKERGKLECLL